MAQNYNREELAWAAGFWDGEGTACVITRTKNRHRALRASVNQSESNAENLKRFHTVIGFGRMHGPYRAKSRPNSQGAFQVNFDGFENVQALMALLWPWLGSIKRAQFQRVLGVK